MSMEPVKADEPVKPEPIEIRKLDKIETTGGPLLSSQNGG
jgi:hypothetical protein